MQTHTNRQINVPPRLGEWETVNYGLQELRRA